MPDRHEPADVAVRVMKNKMLIEEYDERAFRRRIQGYDNFSDGRLCEEFAEAPDWPFYRAPVLILVFATPDVVNDHDSTLAAENMM